MMKSYARIEGIQVAELFHTDEDITELFHPELVWVEIPQGVDVICGWTYTNDQFAAPVIPAPTDGELRAAAITQRDALLADANESTAGMADAYIAGLLDDNDTAMFKAFASYKLALNKIDKQPGYPQTIDWPVRPD